MIKQYSRYIKEVFFSQKGEYHSTLFWYFFPEFITNLIVYSMPLWLDAVFIGSLTSIPLYATLGVTNNIIHLAIKIAEALAVSTVVLSGTFNGQGNFKRVGLVLQDAFWITCFIGFCFASGLFFGGKALYTRYGVSPEIINLGLPYIKIRAIGVFFMFIYFAFVGFLRGIKNPQTPMKIFMGGAIIFIIADYILIFGKFGFPQYGLQGSAIATALQYISMSLMAFLYILLREKNKKYEVSLLSGYHSLAGIKDFLVMSTPIIIDKATIAIAYIWLGMMIAPMGTHALAAFSAIKDIERFAFLPAIAWAHVITFIVSNNIGARDFDAVKINIKKILWMSGAMIGTLLLCASIYTKNILFLFDKKGDFTELVCIAFPMISGLVMLDLLQIILSGALRGSGNVFTVMIVRSLLVFLFFMPLSYMFSLYLTCSDAIKITLIYGSFYISNGLMSLCYLWVFKNDSWKKRIEQQQ